MLDLVPVIACEAGGYMLEEMTEPGLHGYLATIIPSFAASPGTAVDLGAGTGAFANRLCRMGFDVTAVERAEDRYRGTPTNLALDLDDPSFHKSLPSHASLVTAIEIIEHLENPISFLRNVRELLSDRGTAIITSPNVDSLVGRLKFGLRGEMRMMGEHSGDPTHITPIITDLFRRQWVPRAGLEMVGRLPYPSDRAFATVGDHPVLTRVLNIALRRSTSVLTGDINIFLLKRIEPKEAPSSDQYLRA
jgi:hypothetical protein